MTILDQLSAHAKARRPLEELERLTLAWTVSR